MEPRPETDPQQGVNQALSLYYEQLAQTRPREFADILDSGASEGVVSGELNTEATAAVVLHTIFGAQRIRALGTELAGMRLDNELLQAFCLHGLSGVR